jgi:tetratricopeptide (TPR) repeat protein
MGVRLLVVIFAALLVAAPLLFLVLSRGARARRAAAPPCGGAPAPAVNPRDAEALLAAAQSASRAGQFETARQRYRQLLDLCASRPGLDEIDLSIRHGIAAFRAGAVEEAHKSLAFAHTKKPFAFEPNHTLGCLESARGNLARAAGYLVRARQADPDSTAAARLLGETLFKMGHVHDSIPLLRRAWEHAPGDTALLFLLGQAFSAAGKGDTAAKIFSRLRTDPARGARAALLAARLKLQGRQYDAAIEDLEIGLRHGGTDQATTLELRYALGTAWVRRGDVAKGLEQWKAIAETSPSYRDVPELIARCTEISSNAKLKAYLVSPTSDFVTLCRRLCGFAVARSRAKILAVALRQREYVDITAEVDTGSWHATVLFRFVRAGGVIGEMVLRDMYARIREIKAGRGICVAPASFSPAAVAFAESRILDLVDKPALLKLLAKIQWTAA